MRLWRSTHRYARIYELRWAAADRNAVAFTYGSRLLVAAGGYRAVERPVARNELPLGWSRDGLLFASRGHGERGDLRLRARNGTLLAVVWSSPRKLRFDAATQTVLAVTRDGGIERFDGRTTTELARLRALGLPIWS